MLAKESDEFLTWPIIPELLWSNSFSLEHLFKERLSMSSSLHRLMHIKIKEAERFDLLYSASCSIYEKVSFSYFDYADHLIALSPHIETVV